MRRDAEEVDRARVLHAIVVVLPRAHRQDLARRRDGVAEVVVGRGVARLDEHADVVAPLLVLGCCRGAELGSSREEEEEEERPPHVDRRGATLPQLGSIYSSGRQGSPTARLILGRPLPCSRLVLLAMTY